MGSVTGDIIVYIISLSYLEASSSLGLSNRQSCTRLCSTIVAQRNPNGNWKIKSKKQKVLRWNLRFQLSFRLRRCLTVNYELWANRSMRWDEVRRNRDRDCVSTYVNDVVSLVSGTIYGDCAVRRHYCYHNHTYTCMLRISGLKYWGMY